MGALDESRTKEENQSIFGNLAISKWVLGRRVDAFGTCPSPCAENQEVVPSHRLQRKAVLRNLKTRYFLINTPKGLCQFPLLVEV